MGIEDVRFENIEAPNDSELAPQSNDDKSAHRINKQ